MTHGLICWQAQAIRVMHKELDDITTMIELEEFRKHKPDYITADDIMFAIVRINEIERSKQVKLDSGYIRRFLQHKYKTRN
jgi:hypothetical protein